MVEWLREAKNRGRNFAFAGEIYLLDFFRLTRQPVGRGEVRSFVGEVLMISPRANCSCMRKTRKLMDYRKANVVRFFFFFFQFLDISTDMDTFF